MSVAEATPIAPAADVRPAFTVEENADGSAIVKLRDPVMFQGESLTRLTIPRLTGRHMRRAGWIIGEKIAVGRLVEFAAEIIEPVGVVDELPGPIALNLGSEVIVLLGKSGQIGAVR